MLTFFVAVWLLAFSFMKAGKLVNYISAPVMGGFITGICSTIILMQVPKILGGTAGTGEFFELAKHIGQTARGTLDCSNSAKIVEATLSERMLKFTSVGDFSLHEYIKIKMKDGT